MSNRSRIAVAGYGMRAEMAMATVGSFFMAVYVMRIALYMNYLLEKSLKGFK